MGKFVNDLDQKIKAVDKKRYQREQYQSFMTAPEWRSVEMAEEYGKYLRDGGSLFHFPYFRQLYTLWKIVFNTYFTARKYNSFSEVVFSDYMAMDILVPIFTTMEFLPKAILSLFIAPFIGKENNTPMQKHIAEDFYQKYASELQTKPFYDHEYGKMHEPLAQKYKEQEKTTWADWFTWKIVSWDLWGRKWLSMPFKYWFHQEDNLVPATTDVLVKFDALDIENPELAEQAFRNHIGKVSENHNVQVVGADVYAKQTPKQKNDHTYTSVYARLSAPRYAAFQQALVELGKEGIHLRKIAGQDRVQVKCTLHTDNEETLKTKKETLKKQIPEGTAFLYSYQDQLHPTREILLFDVPVRNLHESLELLRAQAEVSFVHNF